MAKDVLDRKQSGPSQAERLPRADRLARAVVEHRWTILVLSALSGLLLSVIFAPTNLWPLAFVALVPWLVTVACSHRRTSMFLISYLLGIAFFFINLGWLWEVTTWPPQGIFGVPIPIGTLLLGLYLGLYFPLAAWLIRFACRRLRVPLMIGVPVVWVATEFVRAYLPVVPYDGHWQYTGLQWFFLAHSQYRVLPLIQVADLAGAYGVSFIVAMINGAIADVLAWRILHREPAEPRWPRRLRMTSAIALTALAGTGVYGVVQLHRDTLRPGPKVAVIQTDEPLFVDRGGYDSTPGMLDRTVEDLLAEALAQKPDVVVVPETMWPYRMGRQWPNVQDASLPSGPRYQLFQRKSNESHQRLQQLADESAATLVIGALSLEFFPDRPHLTTERLNTVFVYRPGDAGPRLYDKIHLVLFGEFIPFRRGHLHRLYNYLNSVMPWTEEYSLTAGTDYRVFDAPAPSQGGHAYRFATPICYEITMSDACRRMSYGPEGKRSDLLINLSNDGWFFYTSELPQHLAVAVFRAVENRVGLARSVNTGISAVVDPTGRIRAAMLKDGQWREPDTRPDALLPWKGLSGVLVQEVPTDPTITLYMRWGNWLPIGCSILAALLLLMWWVDRTWLAVRHLRRGGRAPAPAGSGR